MATRTIIGSSRVSNPNKIRRGGRGGQRPLTLNRVVNTSGNGRGRGHGKGRGRRSKSSISGRSFEAKDEEDDICQLALGQFELETSSLSKALDNAAATTPTGFDETAGQIWIYPTNRPLRDYQFKIVQTALFANTLVSLPTGLGKTFIAAVVIYNFARWYPNSVIVFMAPTRPLVAQQLQACHEIVGIYPSKTVELTGQIAPKKREEFWKSKSVFFLTPQVLLSDLGRGLVPAEKVRCVVVDEAHKALGEQAFVMVIRELVKAQACFRVLALSATPGSDLASVGQVLKNLLISRVELRSENSPDVLPYVHDRNVEKVVVKLDDYLASTYGRVVEIFQEYTGKLLKNRAIHGSSFSQFQLLQARASYRENMQNKLPKYLCSNIENDFQVAISLSRAVDLLHFHGLRSFYTFVQAILNKEKATPIVSYELNKNEKLMEIMSEIQQKLNIASTNSSLNSSSLFTTFSRQAQDISDNHILSICDDQHPQQHENYLDSHPKMEKLKDIVLSHFKSFETKNETTRVMIFCEYRDSVQEIGYLLSTLGNLVKPMVFIGQSNTGSKGLKQKDQIEVMARFRGGGYNVLVSTCVGEEGLDIGEVDLIVCFDSKRSPTRLVQRMGRTGRQRTGKIIFLLTTGKEENAYNTSCSLQSSISKHITDGSKLTPFLYKTSPRMIPSDINPQCFKMNILLTSEHGEREDVEIIEIDDEEVEVFAKPSVSRPSTNKKKKTSNNLKSNSGNTIKECFNQMLMNQKDVIPKSSVDNNELLQPFKQQNNNNYEEEEHHESHFGFDDLEEDGILMNIFDVPDPSTFTLKPCLKIPKPPQTFEWLPEYNEIDPSLILLSQYDISCLLQRVKNLKLNDNYKAKCECGKIGDLPEPKQAADENFLGDVDEFLDLQFATEPETKATKTEDEDQFGEDDIDEWIKRIDDFQIAIPVFQNKPQHSETNKLPSQKSKIKMQNFELNKSNPVVVKQNDYSTFMATSAAAKFTFKKKELDNHNIVDPKPIIPLSKRNFDISASPIPIHNTDSESLNGDYGIFGEMSPKFEKLCIKHHSTPKSSKTSLKLKRPSKSPIIVNSDSGSLTGDEELFKNYSTPVALKNSAPSKMNKPLNHSSGSETPDEEEIFDKSRNKSLVDQLIKKQPQVAVVLPFPRTSLEKVTNNSEKVITPNQNEDIKTKGENLKSQAEQLDPELFKDDPLLFEDDDFTEDEDIFEQSILNYNPILEVTKANNSLSLLKFTPLAKKQDEPLKEMQNKENVPLPPSNFPQYEERRYGPHITLLSTPPSIFNRKKNSVNNNEPFFSYFIAETNPNKKSKLAISNPKASNIKMGDINSDSDDDLRDLDLTEYEKAFITDKLDDFELQKKNKAPTFKKAAGFSPKKFTFKQTPKLVSTKSCSIGKQQQATCSTSSTILDVPKKFNQQQNSKKINTIITNNNSKPKIIHSKTITSFPKSDSQIFKKPFKKPTAELSDDDDFVAPDSLRTKAKIPNRKEEARSNFLPSPKSNLKPYKNKNASVLESSPQPSHSKSRVSNKTLVRRKKKELKLDGNSNPFLELEAQVSGDSASASCSSEEEFEGLDEYDSSFVDHENEHSITDSQQAHYLQSVKDVLPVYTRRTKQPVTNQNGDISHIQDEDLDYDENDSFCVPNDESVEIEDIGVYTQAMNDARAEILSEESPFAKKPKTRRQASQARAREVELLKNGNKIKTRKRIIMRDESSSD